MRLIQKRPYMSGQSGVCYFDRDFDGDSKVLIVFSSVPQQMLLVFRTEHLLLLFIFFEHRPSLFNVFYVCCCAGNVLRIHTRIV